MNTLSAKPSQFELFPSESIPFAAAKPRSALKDLIISPENIIVGLIVLVMTFVLAYSFGVERGKKVILSDSGGEKIKFEEQAPNVIITAPATEKKILRQGEANNEIVVSQEKAQPKKEEKAPAIQQKLPAKGLYTIQVASFKLKDHANKEAKQLEKTGQEIFVLSKGEYSIVCVGKFEVKDQADKISKKLKSRYRDLVIRRM